MAIKLKNSLALFAGAAFLAVAGTSGAMAEATTNSLVIEGVTIPTDAKAPEGSPLDHVYSGWRFRAAETQALQTDDFENPGFPAVDLGADLWATVEGSKGKSCKECHNDAAESMKGVRAAMPKWDADTNKPMTMENQINECRVDRMGAKKWKYDSAQMLGMNAYVSVQSRGMPITIQEDGPMASWMAKGKEIYYTRVGQLDMACSNCHEDNFGVKIRSDHLSQGQINGFPVYRLKWAGLGSAHRRFKGCMKNIRAKPYKVGSDEFIALESYVASRGKGLVIETPSVRN